jgi:hypothetical protein
MKEHSGEMSGEEMATDRWENEGGLATQLARAGRKEESPQAASGETRKERLRAMPRRRGQHDGLSRGRVAGESRHEQGHLARVPGDEHAAPVRDGGEDEPVPMKPESQMKAEFTQCANSTPVSTIAPAAMRTL